MKRAVAAKRCGEDKPERKMSLSFVDDLQAQVEKLEKRNPKGGSGREGQRRRPVGAFIP
jgi:hypothetical protein